MLDPLKTIASLARLITGALAMLRRQVRQWSKGSNRCTRRSPPDFAITSSHGRASVKLLLVALGWRRALLRHDRWCPLPGADVRAGQRSTQPPRGSGCQ